VLVYRLEWAVCRSGTMDEITSRSGNRRPVDRYLAPPAHCPNVCGRRERGRRRGSITLGLRIAGREPGDPGRAGPTQAGGH